jgi:hypothetical protein
MPFYFCESQLEQRWAVAAEVAREEEEGGAGLTS